MLATATSVPRIQGCGVLSEEEINEIYPKLSEEPRDFIVVYVRTEVRDKKEDFLATITFTHSNHSKYTWKIAEVKRFRMLYSSMPIKATELEVCHPDILDCLKNSFINDRGHLNLPVLSS